MPVGKRKKNGRTQWCADYADSAGRRVQKFFPTKEAAEDGFAEAVTLSRQKTTPDLPTTITVSDYVQHWLQQLQAKQRTREAYTAHLRLYLLPTLGSLRLRDLQRGRLKALLVRQRETLSRSTVKLTLGTLRSMLNTAVDDELLVANPAAGLGRALKLSPRAAIRTEQIKAMEWEQRDLLLTTATRRMPWWAPMWSVQVHGVPPRRDVRARRSRLGPGSPSGPHPPHPGR